jgi:hypothetical protein
MQQPTPPTPVVSSTTPNPTIPIDTVVDQIKLKMKDYTVKILIE